VDVRSFAPPVTPRDGAHPWDIYIQAAVDHLIASSMIHLLEPMWERFTFPGQYLLNQPIQIVQVMTQQDTSKAYIFCSIQIIGDSRPFEGAVLHGSALLVGFTDKPAIIIQCGRAVTLKNLAILGKINLYDANVRAFDTSAVF
jgi:hypothetical protein